jgi:parallel beta-helix repeat protein
MKRHLFLATVTLLFSIFIVSGASAITICVENPPTISCPYSTIQAAVDASKSWDTIIIRAGIYDEKIVIYKNLRIKTEGDVAIQQTKTDDAVITIKQAGKGSKIIGLNIWGGRYGIVLDHADNCTISGNRVLNHIEHGIVLDHANHNKIINNIASSFQPDGQPGDQIDGIFLDHSDHNRITGNEITHSLLVGISLDYSSYNLITGNSVSFTDGDGIALDSSDNNRITGNSVTYSFDSGISLYFSSNNDVTDNTVSDIGPGISTAIGIGITGDIYEQAQNNLIADNKVMRVLHYGIGTHYAIDTKITRNLIESNPNEGIHIGIGAMDTLIERNTITKNDVGIFVLNADDNTARRNNIMDNITLGVQNVDTVQFDATSNYWGTSGPNGQTSGNIDTDRWLIHPIPWVHSD